MVTFRVGSACSVKWRQRPLADAAQTGAPNRGHCLCGDIELRISGPIADILHCHCDNCRRISGNYVAASRVAFDDLEVVDPGERLGWHHLPYARYGFCSGCGSTLFFVANYRPDMAAVMVGVLDDVSGLTLGGVWFADDAQHHNPLPTDVPHFSGSAE